MCSSSIREFAHIFLLWRKTHTGNWQVCLSDQRVSALCLRDQRTSHFSPNLQTLYCLPKSHAEVWTSFSPHVFFCLLLVIVTYILVFFPVICWSYLRTEISATLSVCNKLYSRHHILFFSFPWDHFVYDVILRLHWIC